MQCCARVRRAAGARWPSAVSYIALHRQMREQAIVLGHESDRPQPRRPVRSGVIPDFRAQCDARLPHRQQTGNGAQD